MQLSSELVADNAEGLIRRFGPAGIDLGTDTYPQGLILSPKKREVWLWPNREETGYQLTWADLPSWVEECAQSKKPWESVLLGINLPASINGDMLAARRLFAPFQSACAAHRIGCDIMNPASAARTYNILATDARRVLAVFWLGVSS